MLQSAILHHDNTPSHRAAPTTKTIKRLGFELFSPPLTHLDMAFMIFSLSIEQECFVF